MKRALIIRSGAFGDLILTLPVLSALKNHYDGLSIDMMGDPARLALLKHCGCVDDVLSIDSRDVTPLFTEGGSLSGRLKKRLESYDAILSYLPDPDGRFTDNLRRIASGPVLTGRSRPAEGGRVHMTRVLANALKPLGVDDSVGTPRVDAPLSAASDDLRRLTPEQMLVAIHPGSGGVEKCWPAERFAALIDMLADSGYRPMVTFGPADGAVRRRMLPCITSRDVSIFADRSLVDMAALYARCCAMIGNDSGMTHLAAAAGAPVIALFGPTDPAVWGPRGKGVRILWGNAEIDGDVDRRDWNGPFCPRSLAEIEMATLVRILPGIDTSAEAAENRFKGKG